MPMVWLLLLFQGCSLLPEKQETVVLDKPGPFQYHQHLEQPAHYLDNELKFQPKRIWRLWVSWELDQTNRDRAYIIKEFQHIVREKAEREKLENEIQLRGGDTGYLQWYESSVFPLGNWDETEKVKVLRLKDFTMVLLVTRSKKPIRFRKLARRNEWHQEREVEKTLGKLLVRAVGFPDPLMSQLFNGCSPRSWQEVRAGESVGTEVVLETRREPGDAPPIGYKWQKKNLKLQELQWLSWSVGQGNRISYRQAVFIHQDFAQCPKPPHIHEVLKQARVAQPMEIDW